MSAVREGRFLDQVPLTGQSAGAIRGIEPAGDIVHRIAAEAIVALGQMANRLR
jgi:hypothetical protein